MNIWTIVGLVCASATLLTAFLVWAACKLGGLCDEWMDGPLDDDYDGEWLGR